MSLAQELLFIMKARDEASSEVAKVKGNISGMEKGFGAAKAAAGLLGGAVGGQLVGFLSTAARAAADDEANTAKLTAAITASGASYDVMEPKIAAAIASGQALAFADNETRDALAILTAQTGDADEALSRLSLAQDLSRGTGMSLEGAAKLLGKTSDENINVFKRYGVVLDENSTAQDVMAAVQKKFSGQAEAYGSTTQAWMFKVKDAVGEWTESVGASLGPAQGLIALLPGMGAGMSMAGGAVGGLTSLIKGPMISSFLATIPATIAMMAPFLPLILTIAAIGAGILLLKLAWEGNWGDIQGKTKAVMDFIKPLIGGILDVFNNVKQWLADLVDAFRRLFQGDISGIVEKLMELFVGLPKKLIGVGKSMVEGIWSGIQQMAGWLFTKATDFARNIFDNIMKAIKGGSPSMLFAEVGESISMGIAKGFVDNIPHLDIPSVGISRMTGAFSGAGGFGGGIVFQSGAIVINGDVDSRDRVRELGEDFVRQARAKGLPIT